MFPLRKQKMISASDRFIADHQLDVQETAVDAELLRLEMQMTVDSSEKVWAFKENLEQIKRGIADTRFDVHQLPVKKKKFWDRFRIRVYLWSVRGRFE